MKKTRLLATTLAFVALLQVVSADPVDLEIVRPNDGATFKANFDGTIEINVTVKNNGDDPALNVTLEVDSSNMAFEVGNDNQEIGSGDKGYFVISGSGLDPRVSYARVRIRAKGSDSLGESYESDRITITIYPPLLKAKIIAPVGTKRIVYPTTGSYNFKVWVENQGEADLAGVELVFELVIGNFSCSYSGPQDIRKGEKTSYNTRCTGLESGDSLRIRAYDAERLSKDMEIISFYFIEPVAGKPGLQIVSPQEGENITISETMNIISVVVRNNGSETADDVCVTVENLDVSEDNCSNIEPGETHTFVFSVERVPGYVVTSVIEANAISSDLLERVSVRIKPLVESQNISTIGTTWIGENLPAWLENMNYSRPNATDAGGDMPQPVGVRPAGDLSLLILIIVAALLGIYIVMGIYWKGTKKGRREKMLEERRKKIEEFDREFQKSQIK